MTSQALSQRMTQTDRVQRLRFELVATEFLVRMGGRIEQRRLELGLSRADLARQMPGKVNENQIYRWEKGKHNPNPDTLQALAEALDVDVAQLMAPPPKRPSTPDLSGDGERPTAADLMAAIKLVEDQVRLLRADLAIRDAEDLQRTEASDRATPASRRQQRR